MSTLQAKEVDVVYLNYGSIIKGEIIDQNSQPDLVKVKSIGGMIYEFKRDDIKKISKEPENPLTTNSLETSNEENTVVSMNVEPFGSSTNKTDDQSQSLFFNYVKKNNNQHALGIASWSLTLLSEDNDESFNGIAATYEFSIVKHFAIRATLYHATHEDLKELYIQGYDGQLLLTSNAYESGIKWYIGAGYFNENWKIDGIDDEASFGGKEVILGLGYNWEKLNINLTSAGRFNSDYDANGMMIISSSINLAYRF